MKHNVVILMLIFFGLQMTCGKDMPTYSIPLQKCFNLKFSRDEINICYDSLVSESRCPRNAVCVWEGVAEARFSLTTKDGSAKFVLATMDRDGYRNKIDTLGYRIQLMDIQPYPDSLAPRPTTASVWIWKG